MGKPGKASKWIVCSPAERGARRSHTPSETDCPETLHKVKIQTIMDP